MAIVGGGAAGSWMLARLLARGVEAVLVDDASRPSQTALSQGILHRGAKYLLRAQTSEAARRFPDLGGRWRAALDGRPVDGDPDLGAIRPLAAGPWLVAVEGLSVDLAARLAAARRRGLVEEMSEGPAGSCVRLLEPILDPPDLLEALHRATASARRAAEAPTAELVGDVAYPIQVRDEGSVIRARRLVLAAGAGNAELLAALGRAHPRMRRRPIHMVTLTTSDGTALPARFAHVLDPTAAPGRDGAHWTVTSHPLPGAADGRSRWWLGGDPSEVGLERSSAEQATEARRLVRRAFPEIDVDSLDVQTQIVERAEPELLAGRRQLDPFLHVDGAVLTAWPMKLALVPLLADRAAAALGIR